MPFKNDTEMILKGYVDEIPHILLFFYNKYRKTKGEQYGIQHLLTAQWLPSVSPVSSAAGV